MKVATTCPRNPKSAWQAPICQDIRRTVVEDLLEKAPGRPSIPGRGRGDWEGGGDSALIGYTSALNLKQGASC